MKKVILILLAIVGFIPIWGQNKSPKRVAILEIVDKDGKMSYGAKLMIRSNLAEAITATPGYEGYDRVDISSIMSEQSFQRTGLVSDAEIKRLGEMTGAQSILLTEVVKLDEHNLYIAAKILNVESARIENAMNVQTTIDVKDIQQMSKVMAKELLKEKKAAAYEGVFRKVAILEIVDRANEINNGVKFMIRSNITQTITKTPGYEGYDRVDISSIMNEHEFQRTGLVSETDIKRLGEMTGASYILIAEVAPISSEMLFLTAKILDVETARIEKTANLQSGTSSTELQEASISLAKDLFGWVSSKEASGYVITDDMTISDLRMNADMLFNEGNYTEAFKLFELAIEKGDWGSYWELGYIYEMQEKWDKAITCYDEYLKHKKRSAILKRRVFCDVKLFNSKANTITTSEILNQISSLKKYANDYPEAKRFISEYYMFIFRNGSFKQDTDAHIEAFKWHLEEANQGNMYAQYNIAFCYKHGWATKKDAKKFKYWMRKAAEQGYSEAIDYLNKYD